MNTTTICASPAELDHSDREGSLVAPPGFRPATSKDFTDRPEGWVGPVIYGRSLVDGRFEPEAVMTWTPDEGMVSVLNADFYRAVDSVGAEEAFGRLDDMRQYAALEAEATSPSQLARSFRECPDAASYLGAPWESDQGAHRTLVEEAMSVHDVIAGATPIGLYVDVSLDEFERLGLDVSVEGDLLQLVGTREEIAAAADLFATMGAKLKAFLDERNA